jgi:serine/threonine protein kinase
MGSCFDTVNNEMLLVMEFMARGSLNDVLMDAKSPLSYAMKLHLATQAAQGMNFLHQSNPPTIHHDLKSHNILLGMNHQPLIKKVFVLTC